MPLPAGYKAIQGSDHAFPKDHQELKASAGAEQITVTLILRRRTDGAKMRALSEFAADANASHQRPTREQFAAAHGADPKEMAQVEAFARANGLEVVESHPGRRSVVVRGTVDAINKAFAVQMRDFQSPRGRYRSHDGPAAVPAAIASMVEAVVGLHERPIPAQHFASASLHKTNDPPNTHPLSPQDVARLYDFPDGDGAGETIGIYEMETRDGPAGYSAADIADTMRAFGGGLKIPKPIDVAVDGVGNSGVSDGETGLDITIAAAIAQGAKIAVYFAGPTPQNIIHTLQRMIHPGAGDPQPSIISISYGWGPDDPGVATGFSEQDYTQIGKLFQDAANLKITVLVSSGDSGCVIASPTQAQTSYPASELWVTACGGTTIGNIDGLSFDEVVWNDLGGGNPGATGGGVSARFPVPPYQRGLKLPKRNRTNKAGRGVPDIAGNASANSGYVQFINGRRGPVGGTSAVAPLYAGLIARINANLGHPVGFLNPTIYSLANTAFRDIIAGPSGPPDNSFGRATGYPARSGWDACTGLGSVKGKALEDGLRAAHTKSGAQATAKASIKVPRETGQQAPIPAQVFRAGTFKGVSVTNAFALAAMRESPIIVDLPKVQWPAGLAPTPVPLGNFSPGEKITGALKVKADALIILYTQLETRALLGAFTGDNTWSPARQKKWCGYAHGFDRIKPIIANIGSDNGLKDGLFGYLSAFKIGTKTVVLYKSELHPKQNGNKLPFVPVIQQLVSELKPDVVISTGTAGAIGSHINCGDVAVATSARFHVRDKYPTQPQIDTLSANKTALQSSFVVDPKYLNFASENFTKLSLDGLAKCHVELEKVAGYEFVKKNTTAPKIYVTAPAGGPQPMAVVSADYLTVDDNNDSEGLQPLGIMNETDDAFAFYAMGKIPGKKIPWVSVRNASEPQIEAKAFPPGTSQQEIVRTLAGTAGRIYGIYQYCTTLNSAFACWGVVAGL